MLFNEPKLLKFYAVLTDAGECDVSVLFNEPKLLKFGIALALCAVGAGFSALQRAEIAEISCRSAFWLPPVKVSVLFNEPKLLKYDAVNDAALLNPAFQCSSTSRNC